MCFFAYRGDPGSDGAEFQGMGSGRFMRVNYEWSSTSEGREAPYFLKTLTQALAEADEKEGSTDEPRR